MNSDFHTADASTSQCGCFFFFFFFFFLTKILQVIFQVESEHICINEVIDCHITMHNCLLKFAKVDRKINFYNSPSIFCFYKQLFKIFIQIYVLSIFKVIIFSVEFHCG